MGSFWNVAVLAVLTAIWSPAHAESIAAALTPPLPRAELPTPNFPDAVPFFGTLPMPQTGSRMASPQPVAEIVARQANISNFGTACDPSITLETAAGAMLDLEVHAPCLPSSMVTVAHTGLSFTLPLSMTGTARIRLPAMTANAQITASLFDGKMLAASASVPQVRNYARVALQWDGPDPGELVSVAPTVLNGEIFRLGTASNAQGKVLHVFSRRMDDVNVSGVVRLSLRSDVTAQNCAKGHATKVHRSVPGEPVAAYDMQIKGPGCDAIGQSLELKNVLQDLRLTQN